MLSSAEGEDASISEARHEEYMARSHHLNIQSLNKLMKAEDDKMIEIGNEVKKFLLASEMQIEARKSEYEKRKKELEKEFMIKVDEDLHDVSDNMRSFATRLSASEAAKSKHESYMNTLQQGFNAYVEKGASG